MLYAIFGFVTLLMVLGYTWWRVFPEFFEVMFDQDSRDAPEHRGLVAIVGCIVAIASLFVWPIIWIIFFWIRRKHLNSAIHSFFN